MASVGARYVRFAPIDGTEPATGLPDYDEVLSLGKLIQVDTNISMATGELYADDELAEQGSEFTSATSNVGTDDIDDETAAVLHGATYDETSKELTYNKDDEPPLGGLGYIRVGQKGNQKYYAPVFFPKAKAALPNDAAQTKNNTITFNTGTIPFTVFALPDGTWRKTKRFTGADAYTQAKAWLDGLYGGGETGGV